MRFCMHRRIKLTNLIIPYSSSSAHDLITGVCVCARAHARTPLVAHRLEVERVRCECVVDGVVGRQRNVRTAQALTHE
jgi:hypothetical protein